MFGLFSANNCNSFVLGTYIWGFKHQHYLHIYFDIPFMFCVVCLFSVISIYALSSHLQEACAIVRLDLKVKAQCFSKIDLRMLALTFVLCVYKCCFCSLERVTNEKFVIGTSSGFCFCRSYL